MLTVARGNLPDDAGETRAALDPEAEQLLEDQRRRLERLSPRERLAETVAAGTFLAVALAMAAWLPAHRALSVPVAGAFVVAYAIAFRARFEVGTGFTAPTQLLLVPMLFLLPVSGVPLLVAGGRLLGELPDYLLGRRHPERVLLSVGGSWHAIGPALVLSLAGHSGPDLAIWPMYLLALVAQFGFDVGANLLLFSYERGISPRLLVADAGWICAVDTLLSPIGLLAALGADEGRYTFLLVLPLVGLLAVFARERQARLESALELRNAYRGTTLVLADLVQTDDEYTGMHSRDVVSLAVDVAEKLGLDDRRQRKAEFAALLHDIGKIAVPKEVINKPGPLTPEEWELIKVHTLDGERMLERVGGLLGEVGRIVRSSHEHWDGGGYPDGLAGEQIPIEARIVSCCDAFNAMTTDRPYRAARSVDWAIAELRENAGTQFDPAVTEALIEVVGRPSPAPGAVPAGVNGKGSAESLFTAAV